MRDVYVQLPSYSNLFLTTEMAQRQEADWSYQERTNERKCELNCDMTILKSNPAAC